MHGDKWRSKIQGGTDEILTVCKENIVDHKGGWILNAVPLSWLSSAEGEFSATHHGAAQWEDADKQYTNPEISLHKSYREQCSKTK